MVEYIIDPAEVKFIVQANEGQVFVLPTTSIGKRPNPKLRSRLNTMRYLCSVTTGLIFRGSGNIL